MIWNWLGPGGHASHTSFPFRHFVSHLIPNALSQPQCLGDARCFINVCMSHCHWLIHLILCSLTQSTASLFQMLFGVRHHETRLSSSEKHSAWCGMQRKSSLSPKVLVQHPGSASRSLCVIWRRHGKKPKVFDVINSTNECVFFARSTFFILKFILVYFTVLVQFVSEKNACFIATNGVPAKHFH